MAWIDYKKAFDNLPGTCIVTVMERYQIYPTIRQFVEASVKEWKTEMWLYHTEGHDRTGKVAVKRGMSQGDS